MRPGHRACGSPRIPSQASGLLGGPSPLVADDRHAGWRGARDAGCRPHCPILGLPGAASGQGPRHFREAREAYQRRDFDGAIRHYTLAIESGDLPHPDLFFAFNNRGNAHAARGHYDRALQDYSEALRLNPKFAGAIRNRGTVYARKGGYDRAIRDYSEAARLDPDDPHALIGRGLVYCEKRDFDRAVRDFDAALGICPTCPGAVRGRAAANVGKECREAGSGR